MQQELIEIINLLSKLPSLSLWFVFAYIFYKSLIYLSTTGAIVYVIKQLISKFPLMIYKEKEQEKGYYHGLVRTLDGKTDWLYNRASLEQLSQDGTIIEFKVGPYVPGYY